MNGYYMVMELSATATPLAFLVDIVTENMCHVAVRTFLKFQTLP
jgi:hypothetical protein